MKKAVELENISFSYDGQTKVLDGLELSVPYGCFAVISGEKGSPARYPTSFVISTLG